MTAHLIDMSHQIAEALPYTNVSLLGEGGFAEVYRAFDPRLQRNVALKLLAVHKPEYVERMFREARAQAKIRHESICQIYEMGWLGSRPFIAMQLIDGQKLSELIPSLTLDQKLVIAENICRALQAAHDKGLIHRDLKPANVMVETREDKKHHPFIVDFGLVWEQDNPGLTGSGGFLGTPPYMSPEQIRGERCDIRTDTYGLGVTFYELFSGSPAFQDSRPAFLIRKILEEEPRGLEKDPCISRDLAAVISRSMSKSPEMRYQDASALAEDLRKARRGEAVEATLPNRALRMLWGISRHRVSTVVPLTLVFFLALITVGMQWRADLRLRYQAHYVSLAQDLEDSFRSTLMHPQHDLKPDLHSLLARVESLEADLESKGSLAAGPIHFAVGTGYWLLSHHQEAQEHLQTAWDLGFQEPRVAFSLGRVLAAIYRDRRLDLEEISKKDRAPRLEILNQELREPAIRYLGLARESLSVPTSEVEARLALVEGQLDEALKHIRQAKKQAPWQHEHTLVEAEILEAKGRKLALRGERDEASSSFVGARELLSNTLSIAPSDARAHLGLCRLMRTQLQVLTADGITRQLTELEPIYLKGVKACEASLDLRREHAHSWSFLAELHKDWARALTWASQARDPFPILDAAEEAVREALSRTEDPLVYKLKLANIKVMRLESSLHLGREDLAGLIESTADLLREIVAEAPDFLPALNLLGAVMDQKATYAIRQFGDPIPPLMESCRILERAVRVDPEQYSPRANLSASYLRLATRRLHEADDPREIAADIRSGIQHSRKAVELRPGSGWASYILGGLYLVEGDLELSQGRDPAKSWRMGFESIYSASERAPESPFFATSFLELALEKIGKMTSVGQDPTAAIRSVELHLNEIGHVLSPRDAARIEVLLRMAVNRVRAIRGETVDYTAQLRQINDLFIGRESDDHFTVLSLNHNLMQALSNARAGRPQASTLEKITELLENVDSLNHWLFGVVAVLGAYSEDDAGSRKQLVQQAMTHFARYEGTVSYYSRALQPWREACLRLPVSGPARLELFQTMEAPNASFLGPFVSPTPSPSAGTDRARTEEG